MQTDGNHKSSQGTDSGSGQKNTADSLMIVHNAPHGSGKAYGKLCPRNGQSPASSALSARVLAIHVDQPTGMKPKMNPHSTARIIPTLDAP